jgi:hypothetical protein
MPDPRNVAHENTVAHNKDHAGKPIVPDADQSPKPGKKPPLQHHA